MIIKKIILFIFLIGIFINFFEFFTFFSHASTREKKVKNIIPERIFHEVSNSNKNVSLILRGSYVNVCYKEVGSAIEINHQEKAVTVFNRVILNDASGGICKISDQKYNKEILLGELEPGNYKIYFADSKNEPQLRGVVKIGWNSLSKEENKSF